VIHFGTSGWRGIIGKDFTFSSVRRVAAAIADHTLARKDSPRLIVGHDTRFFSPEFAVAAAEVLRLKGCRVRMCREPIPTPTLSHAILEEKMDGGVSITAGDHPAQYNGVKFFGPDGAPPAPATAGKIQTRAATLSDGFVPHRKVATDFESIELRESYFARLRRVVRFDVLSTTKGRFVCDALHGCGAGWLDRLLILHGLAVVSIRTGRDVLFEGTGPNPSEENLAPLQRAVSEQQALAGLATDGDAGRFGIVDRGGTFVSPSHVLGLVFDYLLETRGEPLGASRSPATTHLVDAVARLHGAKVHETRFHSVGPLLEKGKIALAADESVGMTIRGHLPEKDGILACLLVAEMIAARQASLADQLRDLFRRVGREFWPLPRSLALSEGIWAKLPQRLQADFKQFAGRRVRHMDRTDGLKLILDDDTWLLMRPSQTEPVVGIYTEARTLTASQGLADEAREWIIG
jgi:phosphoglucomutase